MGHNIIAFGDWFRGYNKPSHAKSGEISNKEIAVILDGKKVYEITAPTELLNKRNIAKYIDDNLK
jgi:hypothetical protein